MLLKVGWLYKYGRFLRVTWWSHYWCVLNQITCCISCYKSPQNPKRIKDFYLNGKHQVIIGDRVGRVSLPPWLSRDNMLSIVSNGKKIIFCCSHSGEAEAWKEVLDSFRTEYFPWRSAVTNRIIKNLHKLPEEALCEYNQSVYEQGRIKTPGELLAHHFKHLGIDDKFDDFEQHCFCKNEKPAAEEQQLEELSSECCMVPNYAQAPFNNMAVTPYYGHPQITLPYFQLGPGAYPYSFHPFIFHPHFNSPYFGGMETGASQQLETLRGSLESAKSAIVDAVESQRSQTDQDPGKKYRGIYRKKNKQHPMLSCSGKDGKCYLSCDSDCKSKDSSCSSKNKSSTSLDASSAASYDLTKLIESLGKPLFLKFKQKETDCDTDGTTEGKSST